MLLLVCTSGWAAVAENVVREQWPAADLIEKINVLLTDKELVKVNQLARVPSKDRVYRVYQAIEQGEIQGYGLVLSQIVRTKTMAVLYLLDASAKIRAIEVLAFWEPPEYEPDDKWLRQFQGKGQQDPLKLRQDVSNITGATLSARAVTRQARLAQSIVRLKVLAKK